MVVLPPNFVKLFKFDGYYVNVKDEMVYSIKTGVLTPLKIRMPSRFNHFFHGYKISHHGVRRSININQIKSLCKQGEIEVEVVSIIKQK